MTGASSSGSGGRSRLPSQTGGLVQGGGPPLSGGPPGGLPGGSSGSSGAAQGTGILQQAQADAVQAPAGALKGHTPKMFNRNRANTQKFIQEFDLWKMCNMDNQAMLQPFLHAALALSYIKGPKVDNWVANQIHELYM